MNPGIIALQILSGFGVAFSIFYFVRCAMARKEVDRLLCEEQRYLMEQHRLREAARAVVSAAIRGDDTTEPIARLHVYLWSEFGDFGAEVRASKERLDDKEQRT